MAAISEKELDELIAAIGLKPKPGTVLVQARNEIGNLIAAVKRGDPRRTRRDHPREVFEPVFEHAAALLEAIDGDPQQRVKFVLYHFLDGMEPRFPNTLDEFIKTLRHVADFAREEVHNPPRHHSIYRAVTWQEHLIGILMRVDFEKYFCPVERSVDFLRFVQWIFAKSGPDENGKPRSVSGATIKNAVEMSTLFSEGTRIPETVKKRAWRRLQKADKDEPR